MLKIKENVDLKDLKMIGTSEYHNFIGEIFKSQDREIQICSDKIIVSIIKSDSDNLTVFAHYELTLENFYEYVKRELIEKCLTVSPLIELSEKKVMVMKVEFEAPITDLTGDKFGASIYENQVEKLIDFNRINVIRFPDEIEDIAISFVHGFCKKILKNISKEDFRHKIIIKFSNKSLEELFYSNIEF